VLPDRGHIVNLCRDRYRFAVGFAAAMVRGQVSLLPPSEAMSVLVELRSDFPDLYCLSDGAPIPAGIPALPYPDTSLRGGGLREAPNFPETQVAAVLFTSGSTGRPQANIKRWGSLARSTLAAGARLDLASLPGAVVLGTVPHQHSYGLESAILLPLQHGLALHAERPFFPGDICALIEAIEAPRLVVTTPIHLRALLGDAASLPPVDLVLSATAPLSLQLATATEAAFTAPLFEIYGCSEAGQIAMRRPVEAAEWRCLDGINLRQDANGTWACGEIVREDVLLGDVIELRDRENFILHGRTADLVNIAGKRSSLAYLNHHLNSIEGVRDGVFVMPEDGGSGIGRLMALVVAPGCDAEAILAALRARLEPAFLPRPLYLVDRLPRNELGKLPRDEIIRLIAEVTGR
jgi:acyl-coenzyme A synthetase/AMP-(fatty) acid ligase